MLLARYAPVGSHRYEKLAQAAKSFDKIMEWIPATNIVHNPNS